MISAISSDWIEKLSTDVNHEIRAYINPRGREYGAISSAGTFTAVSSSDNVPGTFNLYQPVATYILPFEATSTIDVLVKPNFSYTSTVFIAGWSKGSYYVRIRYTSNRFVVEIPGTTINASATFSSDALAQVWHRITISLDGSNATTYHNGVQYATGAFDTSGQYDLELFTIGDSSNYYINNLRIIHGYEADSSDVADYFYSVKYRETYFDFNKKYCGRERCNVSEYLNQYTIDNKSTYAAATASVSLWNLDGQFNDDTFMEPIGGLFPSETLYPSTTLYPEEIDTSFSPQNGYYNGTSEDIFLQRKIPLELETVFISLNPTAVYDPSNLPEYPDDPAGTTYLQDAWATTDGWFSDNGTLLASNGLLRFTKTAANGYCQRYIAVASGATVRIKVRYVHGSGTPQSYYLNVINTSLTPPNIILPSDGSWVTFNGTANSSGGSIGMYLGTFASTNTYAIEVDWVYVGTGKYLDGSLADTSGNGNNATIYGGVPDGDDGIIRDGINDYERTVDAIAFPDVFHYHERLEIPLLASSYQMFFGVGVPSGACLFFDRVYNSRSLLIYYFNGSLAQRFITDFFETDDTPVDADIEIDIPNETYMVYKNGVVFASGSLPGIVRPTTTYWFFGNRAGLPSDQFCGGRVSNRRIYNRSLSVDEIQSIANGEPLNDLSHNQIEPLFIGSIPPGSFSRNVSVGGVSNISVSADDGIADIAKRIVRKNRAYEDYYLTNTSSESTSLFHVISRLATQREVYNYLCNSSFENATISNSWIVEGGTLSRSSSQALFGTYSGLMSGTRLWQAINIELSQSERFNFSVFIYSSSAMNIQLQILEQYNGVTIGGSQKTVAHDGHGWMLFDVTHDIQDSSSNRLVAVVKPSSTSNIYLDCAMLVYGDYKPYFVNNTNDGTVGICDSADSVLGSYDWIGIDADTVSYQHPWAVVNEGSNVWDYLQQIGDATIARYIYVDRSGVLKYRSTFNTSLPSSLGSIENISAISSSVQSDVANKVKVAGVYINKASAPSCVWQVEASGLENENEDGNTFSRTIAPGYYFPTLSEAPDGYEAKYGDAYEGR